MKIKIRIGEGCVLSRHKHKPKQLYRYISLLAVLTIMCLYAAKQVSAQQAEPAAPALADIKPLQIGDTIPEYLWHLPLQVVNHPEGKSAVTLHDYRGELIILDFWATWCVPCLRDFPKQDSLKQLFPDQLTILKATYQTADRITGPTYSIVNDSLLRAFFPYRQIPHYVWVDPSGVVKATSASRDLSASNIKRVLQNERWTGKIKVDRNPGRPILLDTAMTDSLLHYAILYRGKLDGYATEAVVRKANGQVRGYAMLNRPIYELYMAALIPLFKEMGERYHPKVNVLPPDLEETLYSMDFIVPYDRSDSLYHDLLSFLNASSPYSGRIVKQKTACLIIKQTKNNRLPAITDEKPAWKFSRSEAYLRNKSLWVLTQALNGRPDFSPLQVVDETGIAGPVNIRLSGITTTKALARDLEPYGLSLVEAERELYQFILTPKTNETTR